MKFKNNKIRNIFGTTIFTLCLAFGSIAFAMDDMMGKMPVDPAATDTLQNDPNDTSNSTAGNHNHKKMIKEHEKMINDHKKMMMKDARAQMGKMKTKKMPMYDPADTTTSPDSNMPAGDAQDM